MMNKITYLTALILSLFIHMNISAQVVLTGIVRHE
jgi:hypothetical protein